MNKTIFMLLILLSCSTPVSLAYEAIEVKNGGGIEGIVMFAGTTIPQDETLTIGSDVKFCGKSLPAEKYLVTSDRRVKNVVVYIANISTGNRVPKTPVVVDNLKCAFVPHVSVGFKGNKFIMKNSDPILHNVHTYQRKRTMYNIALPQND